MTARPVRAASEGGQVHLELPGHEGLLSLTPEEAGQLALQLLGALPPLVASWWAREVLSLPAVYDAEEASVAQQRAEDFAQCEESSSERSFNLEGQASAERQASERSGDG